MCCCETVCFRLPKYKVGHSNSKQTSCQANSVRYVASSFIIILYKTAALGKVVALVCLYAQANKPVINYCKQNSHTNAQVLFCATCLPVHNPPPTHTHTNKHKCIFKRCQISIAIFINIHLHATWKPTSNNTVCYATIMLMYRSGYRSMSYNNFIFRNWILIHQNKFMYIKGYIYDRSY